ncbi:Major Facilitator Superfamily, partial [Geosmithia morbida]
SVSFVITDLIGTKTGVGDIVGTLGFADELVALVACPAWGLVSDRLGVRWVSAMGYTIIGLALMIFVQARNVYPQLLLARILFAVGGSAAATMVTATLPCLTDDTGAVESKDGPDGKQQSRVSRQSIAFSVESEATITPERYTRLASAYAQSTTRSKASTLSGYVGLATGCGALVALSLFLPLPTRFGSRDGVTQAQAVAYSFYVVGSISLAVAVFVLFGLRNLKGEEGKGWGVLLGLRGGEEEASVNNDDDDDGGVGSSRNRRSRSQSLGGTAGYHYKARRGSAIPYLRLMKESVLLGLSDSRIALGYVGGFVARASTVAISLFIPLFVNTFFIGNGFCHGSPNDPSPELKEECRAAYVLSSILTGVAQLAALVCAPVFGYLSRRRGPVNWPIVVSTVLGMVGYVVFPQLSSPELKDAGGRGGTPAILLVVSLIGISQIGAIVCSLGSLSQGVLTVEIPAHAAAAAAAHAAEASIAPDQDESTEADPLIRISTRDTRIERTRLKGSIAGVYSLCGGAAILILTKLGGYMFDRVSTGAPFYMMALFNGVLLVVSLLLDAAQTYGNDGNRL